MNYTPGTITAADYTWPELKNYRSSQAIRESVLQTEKENMAGNRQGLNGFILLLHIGTDPRRTDKFYYQLPQLVGELKKKGYSFVTVAELLKNKHV